MSGKKSRESRKIQESFNEFMKGIAERILEPIHKLERESKTIGDTTFNVSFNLSDGRIISFSLRKK